MMDEITTNNHERRLRIQLIEVTEKMTKNQRCKKRKAGLKSSKESIYI